MPLLQEETATALLIEPTTKADATLGSATGFYAEHAGRLFLLTNRHVVTGLHQDTNRPLHSSGNTPSKLRVRSHAKGRIGTWHFGEILLRYDDDRPMWAEHPVLKQKMDVVALELLPQPDFEYRGFTPAAPGAPELVVGASEQVSIIGFPFGTSTVGPLTSSTIGMPIWSTGFVASEPELNYENLPVFLVDCRARPGQSGSPVVAVRYAGSTVVRSDAPSISADGAIISLTRRTKFLGIYSGRISDESDLGRVWKASAVAELLDAAP